MSLAVRHCSCRNTAHEATCVLSPLYQRPAPAPSSLAKRLVAALVIQCLAIGCVAPAFADPEILTPPGHDAGVFLDAADAQKTAQKLRDAASEHAELELLRKALAEKDAEIAARTVAGMKADATIDLLRQVLAIREQQLADRQALVLEMNGVLLEARKSIETDQAVIARLDKRVESLEKRAFWSQILGPIGLLLGLVGGVGLMR